MELLLGASDDEVPVIVENAARRLLIRDVHAGPHGFDLLQFKDAATLPHRLTE
ncbi:MAG: hypothetical protein R2749_28455 [Acidimicrobiales bacterium]